MRRDYGSGSISRPGRNGKLQVRLRVIVDGRPTRVSLGYAATRREAVRLLADGRKKFYDTTGHKLPRGAADTVDSFLTRWLDKAIKPGRHSTYRTYETLMRLYVRPVVGQKRLDTLTRGDVEDCQRFAHNRGVSPSTIGLMLTVLGAALTYGVTKEEIPGVRNVVHGADRLYRESRREYTVLMPADIQRLLAVAEGTPYGTLFTLMVNTGLRVGEALALRWQDVDVERGTLMVAHSLQHIGGGVRRLGPTKTERSKRVVYLSGGAIAALKAQRRQQIEAQARAGAEGFPWCNDSGLCFTSINGVPASDSTVRKELLKLLAAAGLPSLRPHDLRHSYATIHLLMGTAPKVVQEQLGHSSIGVTMDRYSHFIPSMGRAAADAMDRALGQGSHGV